MQLMEKLENSDHVHYFRVNKVVTQLRYSWILTRQPDLHIVYSRYRATWGTRKFVRSSAIARRGVAQPLAQTLGDEFDLEIAVLGGHARESPSLLRSQQLS